MVAFACLFQIIFCINMREFRDLRWTVFTLFRGLVGDIPLDKMVYFRPQLAPVLFCVYVTIVSAPLYSLLAQLALLLLPPLPFSLHGSHLVVISFSAGICACCCFTWSPLSNLGVFVGIECVELRARGGDVVG